MNINYSFSALVIPTCDNFETDSRMNQYDINSNNRRFGNQNNPRVHNCEVGVIGGPNGGANNGGAVSAVFAKDNGYDVCLLEKLGRIEGGCYTSRHPEVPPPFNWIDIMEIVYLNTTKINEFGLANYSLNMEAFAARFASIIPFPALGVQPKFIMDLDNNTGVEPGPAPTFDEEDIYEFTQILQTMYPFLTGTTYPDNLYTDYADILVPLKDYLSTHNFTDKFASFLTYSAFTGGLNISEVPALYVFWEITTYLYASIMPGFLFTPFGGCQALYDGMFPYLQNSTEQRVFFNTDVLSVKRPAADHSDGKTVIHFTMNGEYNVMIVDKLIVAATPTLENLETFMDLNNDERNAFRQVKVHQGYYGFELQTDFNLPVSVFNLSNTENYGEPTYPGTDNIYPGFVPGFLAGIGSSAEPNTPFYMMVEAFESDVEKMANLPNPFNATLLLVVQNVNWFPHFVQSDFNSTYNPYTKINNQQGKRNTLYVNPLLPYSDGSTVANSGFVLVNEHLPPK
jgi:hypothetical protein